ncbi:hypothetical protein PVA45_07055 [Entomospira entomophila]|uniref:Uncharacterized protein n=1 Tax=Entomospira entomophila TaxID=2719988 RepID=A0A968GDY0_9SPIO|nr:hypothetical protein [Entomospira entomophilus]NIZ41259.1 hypothetical protein [Entomospira entomophilus]WDI35464.1 hypothetical protein PVA45_07055 [Entomospira entomophilus]
MAVTQCSGKSDNKTHKARVIIDECEKRVAVLLNNFNLQSYETELHELYERLKYADKISHDSELDAKILDYTMQLEAAMASDGSAGDNSQITGNLY